MRGGVLIHDRVAPREGVQDTGDLLTDGGSLDASKRLIGREELEGRAVGNVSSVAEASVGGFLQHVDIPAVDEITMESIAGWISLGKNKWLPAFIWNPPIELGRVVDDLEENGDHVHRMTGRARAVVVRVLGRVGHVRHMIRAVEIDAVPA